MKAVRTMPAVRQMQPPISLRALGESVGLDLPLSLQQALGRLSDYTPQPKVFSGQITSGGLAALGGWMEVTLNPDGSARWRGHAHDSGADGYDFRVSAVVRSRDGRAVAFSHAGHVGGTFTPGSRDHDWDKTHPPQAIVSRHFYGFQNGAVDFQTDYESDLGSALEGALTFVAKFLLGATPAGAAIGTVVFIGVEAGSLISTGSLVPGARVLGNVLWLAGPSNTLLALAAEGIASAGSRSREISEEEYRWADDEVFKGSLPPRTRLVLTDTIGPGGRAFTFPRFDGKITLNMGPDAFGDPRSYGVNEPDAQKRRRYGEVFVHELVHAWQIQHASTDLALLADALVSKICEITQGQDRVYGYGDAGLPFARFNLEQQAQIVSDWFAGRKWRGVQKDETSPYFAYVAGNIRAGIV